MKLHLPKGLFRAVIAAMAAYVSVTCGADSISISFGGTTMDGVTDATSHLGGVTKDGWNIISAADQTNVTVKNQSGAAAGLLTLSNTSGGWSSSVTTVNTVTGVVQRDYLDVPNNTNKSFFITLNANTWISNVTLYMSGDNDGNYSPMFVDGVAYTGGTDDVWTEGEATNWGTRSGVTTYDDTNSINVTGVTGMVQVSNKYISRTVRGTLAGMQVVDVSDTLGYYTTLGAGETAVDSATWTRGDASEATAYGSIEQKDKNLGIRADASGSTLVLTGGDSLNSIAAVENKTTVKSDSAVSIGTLFAYSGAELVLDATLNQDALDISGEGEITLNGDATVTGDVSFGGQVKINEGKTLSVGGTINGFENITGGGTLVSNRDLAIHGETADESYATPTFTGTLEVCGGTLKLGSAADGDNHNWKIKAEELDIKLNGGNLRYFGADSQFGNIDVVQDATYTIHAVTDGKVLKHKNVRIAAEKTLSIKPNWGATLAIESFTGDGSFALVKGSPSPSISVTVDTVNIGGDITLVDGMTLNLGEVQKVNTITNSGGTLSLGTAGKVSHLQNAILNTGTVNLKGDINISSSSDYVFAEAGSGVSYSDGENGFCTAAGNKYVLVTGGTIDLSELGSVTVDGTNASQIELREGLGAIFTLAGSTTSSEYIVNTTVDTDSDSAAVYMLNAADAQLNVVGDTFSTGRLLYVDGHVNVESGKTLVIDTDSTTNGDILTSVIGVGNVELKANASMANSQLTAATGELTISNGATLTIGASQNDTTSISSFSSVNLNNGHIYFNSSNDTFNNVTVQSGGGSIDVYDMGSEWLTLAGTTTLEGNLKLLNNYNTQIKVEKLTGSGNLLVDDDSHSETIQVRIDGVLGYTGQVQVKQSAAGVNLVVAPNLGVDVHYSSTSGEINLTGISAGNKAILQGASGYLKAGTPVTVDVEMLNSADGARAALEIVNGNSDGVYTFSGAVGGTGNIVINKSLASPMNFKFAGGVSNWTGRIDVAAGSHNVYFIDGSTHVRNSEIGCRAGATANFIFDHVVGVTVDAPITSAGNSTLTVNNTSLEGTSFNGAVTADTLVVGSGTVARFNGATSVTDATLAGTVVYNNTLALTGTLTVDSLDGFKSQDSANTKYSDGQNGFRSGDVVYTIFENAGAGTLNTEGVTLAGILANQTMTDGKVTKTNIEDATNYWVNVSEVSATNLGEGKNYAMNGGTLVLGSAAADAAGTILQSVTGKNGTIRVETNASLANGFSSTAGCKLEIGKGGDTQYTLDMGGGKQQNTNISSFGSVELNNGKISLHCAPTNLNNLKVKSAGGVFNVYDTSTTETAFNLKGTTTLEGNLDIRSTYKYNINIEKLAGSGNLSVQGKSATSYSDSSIMTIGDLQGYTGAISAERMSTEAGASFVLNMSSGGNASLKGLTLTAKGDLGVIANLNVAGSVTLGTVTVNGGNTLNVSGAGTLNGFTTAGEGTLTLGGSVKLGSAITNSSIITLADDLTLDVSALVAVTEGNREIITLISGGTVNGTLSADRVAGLAAVTDGSSWLFDEAGIIYRVLPTPIDEHTYYWEGDDEDGFANDKKAWSQIDGATADAALPTDTDALAELTLVYSYAGTADNAMTMQLDSEKTVKVIDVIHGYYEFSGEGTIGASEAINLSDSGNLILNVNAETAQINMAGGTNLTINKELTFTTDAGKIVVQGAGAGIVLGANATLAANRIDATASGATVALSGSGTYDLGGNAMGAGVSLAEDWTGTTIVSGAKNGLALSSYGHAGSTVEVTGWSGHLEGVANQTKRYTYAADLKLTNTSDGASAMNVNDGYNNHEYAFMGSVSGSGTFERSSTKGSTQSYIFGGDVKNWDGKFKNNLSSDLTTNVTFNGSASIKANITHVASGTLNVMLDDANIATDAPKNIAVNSDITASSLTLGLEGDTADTRAAIALNGAVTVGTLNNYAATKITGATTVSTATTLKGDITVGDGGSLALAGTVTAAADVIVTGATVAGVTTSGAGALILTNTTLGGNLTNNANATLTGTVTATADATVTGAKFGTSTIDSGNITLTNGGFTGTVTNNGTLALTGTVDVAASMGTGPEDTYSNTTTGNGFQTLTMSYELVSGTAADDSAVTRWTVGGEALDTAEMPTFDGNTLKVATTDTVNYYINKNATYDKTNAEYATAGALKLNGGELTFATELNDGLGITVADNSSIVLNGEGVELASSSITNTDNKEVSLKGTGIYNVGSALVLEKGVALDSTDWTGTVRTTATESTVAYTTGSRLFGGSKIDLTADTFTAQDDLYAGDITGKNLTLQGVENTLSSLNLTGALTLGTKDTVAELTVGKLDIAGKVNVLKLGVNMLESSGLADDAMLNLNIGESVLLDYMKANTTSSIVLGKVTGITIDKLIFNEVDVVDGKLVYTTEDKQFSYELTVADGTLTVTRSAEGREWVGTDENNGWSDSDSWSSMDANTVKFTGNGVSTVYFGNAETGAAEHLEIANVTVEVADNASISEYSFLAAQGTTWNILEIKKNLSVNKGTLNIGSGVNVFANERTEVLADAVLTVAEASTATAMTGIDNAGTVKIAASESDLAHGSLVVEAGSVLNKGTIINYGNVLAGKGVEYSDSGVNIINIGTIENTGAIKTDGSLDNTGVLKQTAGSLVVKGNLSHTSATALEIKGGYAEVGGNLTNTKSISISGGAIKIDDGIDIEEYNNLTVDGKLDNSGTLTVSGAGTKVQAGSMDNSGTLDITGGSVIVNGDLDNTNGTITIGSAAVADTPDTEDVETAAATYGSLKVTGDLTHAGENATLTVESGSSLEVGGDLTATGMTLDFDGNVTVGGDVKVNDLTINERASFTANGTDSDVDITTLTNNGSLAVGKDVDGTLTGGKLHIGTLDGSGSVEVGSEGSLDITTLKGTGDVKVGKDGVLSITNSVTFEGSIDNQGTMSTDNTMTLNESTDAGGSIEAKDLVVNAGANGSEFTSITTDSFTIDTLTANPTLTTDAVAAKTDGGKITINLTQLTPDETTGEWDSATIIDGGAKAYHLLQINSDVAVSELFTLNLDSDVEQDILAAGLKAELWDGKTTDDSVSWLASDVVSKVLLNVRKQSDEESVWSVGDTESKAGLIVLVDGSLKNDTILDNVRKVEVSGAKEINLTGDISTVKLNGLTALDDDSVLSIKGDGAADTATMNGEYTGVLNLKGVTADMDLTGATVKAEDKTVELKGTIEDGMLEVQQSSAAKGDGLVLDNTTLRVVIDEDFATLDAATLADRENSIVDLGDTESDGDIEIGTYNADGDFIASAGYAKYFDMSTIKVDANGNVVADRNTSFYTGNLDEGATSANGAAGLAMADAVLVELNPQGAAQKGDLADVLDRLDALVATGNTAAADELGASLAGASTAVLGMAVSGDVDRQLQAIRNRTTTMGVDQSVVNADMPYFNAWINAEGDRSELSESGTESGYELSSWGGTVGFDVDFTPTFTAGMALTAMYGDIDTTGADKASGNIDTYYVTAFARYAPSAWSHTFVATVGMSDISLDRHVAGAEVEGETDGLSFGLMYEVGRVFALTEDGSTCLQPVFNVTWKHTAIDAYTEDGSDLALEVDEQTLDTVTFGLGARLQTVVGESMYNRTSILEARVLAKADVGDRSGSADVALSALPGAKASVDSAEMGAFGLEAGAGLTIPVGDEGGSIFMDASVELRSDYTNVNGTVGYRINF